MQRTADTNPGAKPSSSGSPVRAERTNGPGVQPNGSVADNFLDQHILLHALQAMRVGDFSVRLPGDQVGLGGKIADTFNEIVAANESMARQLELVGQVVGREGKIRKRVKFGLSHGAWERWSPRSTR